MENSATQGNRESICIDNAGLILYNPFLATYFSRTGLMEREAFKNDDSRKRAVLLLEYLATGNTTFAGKQLALNKLLCGMPPEQRIPEYFSATENEIEMTGQLQQAIIDRWDKMKNSTVQSLQSTFIMREAVLDFKKDGPKLSVEQKGYDVLLQTLPWVFGTIKTGWMQQALTVEWI